MISKGALITVAILIMVMILGFWLSKKGRPYDDLLFTAHKIAALFMILYGIFYLRGQFTRINKSSILILTLILIGLCLLTLFFTGAMLSIGRLDYFIMKRVHLMISILLTVMVIGFIRLFLKALSAVHLG